MLALTLPEWFTPDNVRNIALVVMIVAAVLIVMVLRFVQRMMMRITGTLLLLVIGYGAWHYRTDLEDCAKTCECRVLHVDIKIPKDKLPVNQPLLCTETAK